MEYNVKEERYKYFGSSDIPILMGLSPFKNRFELLLEKAQLKEEDFQENDYMTYGKLIEPKIREYLNKIHKTDYKTDQVIVGDRRSHSDGFDGEVCVEIKSTSKYLSRNVYDFKDYLVQLLDVMMLRGKSKGFLSIYKRPVNFKEELEKGEVSFDPTNLIIFEVDEKKFEKECEEIVIAIQKAREDLKKIKENPMITEEELQPKELALLGNKVVELEKKLKEFKDLEKEKDEMRSRLYSLMSMYNVKKWETNGGAKITLIEEKEPAKEMVKKFNEEKFKEENEKLYQKYIDLKEIIKSGRAGYVRITQPKE